MFKEVMKSRREKGRSFFLKALSGIKEVFVPNIEFNPSRRKFLRDSTKMALSFGAGLAFGFPQPIQARVENEENVEIEGRRALVPPSLMLHSRDGREIFTEMLLSSLITNNYLPITYLDWVRQTDNGNSQGKPVILSVDDITMAQGNGSFETFRRMKEWYEEAGIKAVFGVITRPDLPQDESRWDEVAEWVRQGFELATHTSYHSNFNAADTTARRDFGDQDYRAEIVASAQMIEEEMRKRGIDYKVRTLITPYGSGYSRQQPNPGVHQQILNACAKTNIRIVVGIVGGREPVVLNPDEKNKEIVYVGRTPPFYTQNAEGRDVPDAEGTFRYLEQWQASNDAIS